MEAIDGLFCEVVRGAAGGEGGQAIGGAVVHFGGGARGIAAGYLNVYHMAIDESVSSHCRIRVCVGNVWIVEGEP